MTVTEVLAAGRWWTTYTRCPRCRRTTLNEQWRSSVDARTAPRSWPEDEQRSIRCCECVLQYGVRPIDQAPIDASSECPGCAAEVPHPRGVPRVRCLVCALEFVVGPRPRAVFYRYRLSRVGFDGWTVTLTRLWAPLWGWRTRRVTLDRIIEVGYDQPVFTESESRLDDRFVVHVRDRDKPVKLWMWTLYGPPHSRREHRALKMVDILRQAVWGRARLIVRDAVGLGPRSWTDSAVTPRWSTVRNGNGGSVACSTPPPPRGRTQPNASSCRSWNLSRRRAALAASCCSTAPPVPAHSRRRSSWLWLLAAVYAPCAFDVGPHSLGKLPRPGFVLIDLLLHRDHDLVQIIVSACVP